MNTGFFRACLAIIVFLFLFVVTPSSRFPGVAGTVAIGNAEPLVDAKSVDVLFGKTRYRIPQRYLAGVTQPASPNGYAAFTLQLLLPNLEPKTPANAGEFDKPGWHNQLRALFEFPLTSLSPEERLNFYLKFSKQSQADFHTVGGKYKLYEFPNMVPHEYYMVPVRDRVLFFSCYRPSDFSAPPPRHYSPYCDVMENLDDRSHVIYSVSRDYRLSIAEIDEKLRSLLKSFVQP